jgi:Response regulator containing a CheY-like receiver domain and an HD-GYP domain
VDILERFAIYSCGLDAEGRLLSGEPGFWRHLGIPQPLERVLAEDCVDELVGREEDILAIARSGYGEVYIPGIRRGKRFIDLYVFPSAAGKDPGDDGDERALLVIKDSTEAMRAQQSILQQRNEIDLLKRDLDKRNEQLSELMATIREQNHELATKIRLKTQDLRRSRLSVIARLARVAEFRDKETGGHIYRIGRSSVLVSRSYGLPSELCVNIFHASLLHDVGKVGIPDSILLKPAALSPEERAVMQTHTIIGSDLLAGDDSPLLKDAMEIARFHHERWDGRGYPEARSGEEIPLVARICSIVDVFDALLSKRPYKDAWPEDRALDLIRRESGTAFDPAVVRAFFAVAPDILKLRQGSFDTEGVEDLPEFF